MLNAKMIARTCVYGSLLVASLSVAVGLKKIDPSSDPASSLTAWRASAIQSLAAMPDADARATAGALTQIQPAGSIHALDLIDRATATTPQAADIASLDVSVCNARFGCDKLGREARARQIDPDNGALWIAALHEATRSGATRQIDDALDSMAKTRRFDVYLYPLGRRFNSALIRLPRPIGSLDNSYEAQRQTLAISLVAALQIPELMDILHACKPGPMTSDMRLQACRSIATSMENGDTLIANMVGLRLHEWTARDASDLAAVQARRRQLKWRMDQLDKLAGTAALSPQHQLEMMFANNREVDGMNAILTSAGLSLDPPASYQPTRPYTRSLLSP